MFTRLFTALNQCHRKYYAPLFVLTFVLLSVFVVPASSQLDVWIDPGHGGNDSGAPGYGGALPNEKDLNIGVAGYLENRLTAFGYFVYRVQNYDTTYFYPPDRRRIANGERPNDQGIQLSCQMLISIHMNDWHDETVRGTETYYATSKFDGKSKYAYREDSTAAEEIHADLMTYANIAFLGCSRDRGIKAKNFAILEGTRGTALLFEVCFISNGCQFNHITSSGNQSIIANGIATGVSGYLTPLPSPQAPPLPNRSEPRIVTASSPSTGMMVASLQEGFEGATFPPTGWTSQTAGLGLPYAWHRTTDPGYVGNGSGAAFVGGASPGGVDEWLVSPGDSLGATDDAIKFLWSGSHVWSSVLDASLSIREVGTTPWTLLWSIANDEPSANPFIYRERVVDLSAWIGTKVEFGFRVVGTDGADFALDDIVVGDFDPTTPPPNDVCTNATVLGTTFSIQDVTCYATNDLDPSTPPPGSCVGTTLDGSDVFYEFVVAFGDSLHASVTAEWNPGVYVVDECANPVCVLGGYAEDGRGSPTIDHRFINAGTYYLVVDGEEGRCGPYQLDGEIISTVTGVTGVGAVPSLSLTVRPNPTSGPIAFFGAYPPSQGTAPIIEIYNVAGKRLLRVAGPVGSAEFSYVWDNRDQNGTPVASGLYFARLQVGPDMVVQKFVILR